MPKPEKPDVKLLIGFRDLVAECESYRLAYLRAVRSKDAQSKEKKIAFRRAVKVLNYICIPDALRQLGVTVKPAEDLSVWVKRAINSL